MASLLPYLLVASDLTPLDVHCVKNVRVQSFSGRHFPAFGLNTERSLVVSLCIQSKFGKIRTRKTPNTDIFHAVVPAVKFGGYKSYRRGNVKHFINIYINMSKKAEPTTLIRHIERFSKSGIPLYNSESQKNLDKARNKYCNTWKELKITRFFLRLTNILGKNVKLNKNILP